jgi:hypothetical protein
MMWGENGLIITGGIFFGGDGNNLELDSGVVAHIY